jgi:outer membrane protein assembly factor BamD (BamD/ComL family)
LGGKHAGAGKHFYLYVACLIFLVLFGCATPEETGKKDIANINLLYSRALLASGDYKGALKEIQGILSLSPNNTYRDQALFQAGLIYAHHMNPEKDFKVSLGYFSKLIKEHPQSPLVEEAKIWVGVLDVIEKSKQVDIEIEKKRKQLTQ